MEEVVGVAAPEADDAEDGVEGDGGRQPAHQRPEPGGGHQVARHVHVAAALFREPTTRAQKLIQGDHSGCVKPPVDIKTKVAL